MAYAQNEKKQKPRDLDETFLFNSMGPYVLTVKISAGSPYPVPRYSHILLSRLETLI